MSICTWSLWVHCFRCFWGKIIFIGSGNQAAIPFWGLLRSKCCCPFSWNPLSSLSFPNFHRSLLWPLFQGFIDNSTSLTPPCRKRGIVSSVDLDFGKLKQEGKSLAGHSCFLFYHKPLMRQENIASSLRKWRERREHTGEKYHFASPKLTSPFRVSTGVYSVWQVSYHRTSKMRSFGDQLLDSVTVGCSHYWWTYSCRLAIKVTSCFLFQCKACVLEENFFMYIISLYYPHITDGKTEAPRSKAI